MKALIDACEMVKPHIDLQRVAFPRNGLCRDPNALDQTLHAPEMGVDVVGAVPHPSERTCSAIFAKKRMSA